MSYIYTNTRDGKKYILNPQVNMGEKVCLVDMSSCEDKFVSPKTLKRWYSKEVTEDVFVELKAFTGMTIGMFRVYPWSDTRIALVTKKDKILIFDTDTMKQVNANNPKFANKLGLDYSFMQSSLDWALS